MHKCEHGIAITKFCMFEHCQSKESGGCQDCIRRHHNHIGQVLFLNEEEIKSIVKKFQIQANYRPKSRMLQENIFNFFTYIKATITANFDSVCKNLINQIGYPYLHKNNMLNCYKRLKNKQYRKVTQKELKELYQLNKSCKFEDVIKEEKLIYNQAIAKMEQSLQKMESNFRELFQTLNSMTKSNPAAYDRTNYVKISETFKQIKKYPDICFPKMDVQIGKPSDKSIQRRQKQPPMEKKKSNRDVSLDKHLKIQNKLRDDAQDQRSRQKLKLPSAKTNQQNKTETLKVKESKQSKTTENQKQLNLNRSPKILFQVKKQDISLRSPNEAKLKEQFSEKQEQILQRKKKLMDLMSQKPLKKQQPQTKKTQKSLLNNAITPDRIYQNKFVSPDRRKYDQVKIQVGDELKESQPEKYLINTEFSTPSHNLKSKNGQWNFVPRNDSYRSSVSSKRAKTLFDDEEDLNEQKKGTRHQTVFSSETQTQPLFNATFHIPFQDAKQEDDFEIKEQSMHKCIVVPEVDIDTIQENSRQCRSPLLIKKKQIQNFSVFMKLAESKIVEQIKGQPITLEPTPAIQIQKSFVKLNNILQESNSKEVEKVKNDSKGQGSETKPKEYPSVEIDQNQQKSLALLLHSLKLPASQAMIQLQKALTYSSNNLSAAEYLSYLYIQAERPQDCLKLCNEILKNISSPDSNNLALRLNINKSAALNHLGRYSQCITFLQRCLRYRHNDILYKNLADAYFSIGILQKAIYNYQHSILQNSSNTQAHYNLSVCHYLQQNYHNASIYVDKALKHQPTNETYKQMQKHIEEKIFANELR